MRFSALRNYVIIFLTLVTILGFHSLTDNFTSFKLQQTYASSPIQHVFIIAMENHDWRDIKGNSQAPYINSLLSKWAHAEQYYNPPNNHPSAPNYVWLEAGGAVAGANDCMPTDSGCSSSGNHLSKLLDAAGISWKEYAEDTNGTSCILDFSGADVNHVGFSYFTDVTNNNNSNSSNCITHERPYAELATDLKNNTVARYTFITPNLNDDMHDGTIQQGDTWLSQQVPIIMNSQAYQNGVIFITWDEGEGDDGPIGMIAISTFAKKNYSNTIHYDHSSTLKTLEEIFGVGPLLGGAANATDLSDLFTIPLTGSANPSPTDITPTVFCVGGSAQPPCATIPPSGTSNNPTVSTPSTSPNISTTPTQNPCMTGTQTASVQIKEHTKRNGAISNLLLLLLQLLIQLLQQLLGGTITIPNPGSPTPTTVPSTALPGTNPSAAPTVNPCITPSTNVSIAPSSSINPSITGSSSQGPKTSLHYTSNSNFSGTAYTPGADGFNIADVSSPTELNTLPNGVKGLIYLNLCNGADSNFITTVQPFVGNSKVFGFYLIDEPDPTGKYKTLCPASMLKAESDWIHSHDQGAKTFIILMNMAASRTPTYMNTYNPSNSDIDYFGIDAYPCRTDYNGCDFTIVTRNITAANAAGIPIANIVPVYQTFGGGSWTTDGGGKYTIPTASQETQLLTTWASVIPSPGFDYAYSWGTQNGDQALSGDSALQQIFSAHNK
jgi:hypothetical protein